MVGFGDANRAVPVLAMLILILSGEYSGQSVKNRDYYNVLCEISALQAAGVFAACLSRRAIRDASTLAPPLSEGNA